MKIKFRIRFLLLFMFVIATVFSATVFFVQDAHEKADSIRELRYAGGTPLEQELLDFEVIAGISERAGRSPFEAIQAAVQANKIRVIYFDSVNLAGNSREIKILEIMEDLKSLEILQFRENALTNREVVALRRLLPNVRVEVIVDEGTLGGRL